MLAWTTRTCPFDGGGAFRGCYAADLEQYAAVGDGPGDDDVVSLSTDGVAWSAASTGLDQANSIARSITLGLYIVGGASGGVGTIITSPDGGTWTSRATPWPVGFGSSVACREGGSPLVMVGGFVLFDPSHPQPLLSATDGLTYAPLTSPFDGGGSVTGIAHSAATDRWIAGGHSSLGLSHPRAAYTDDDGATWTTVTQPLHVITDVYHDEDADVWYMTGQSASGEVLALSTDNGATWTLVDVTPLFGGSASGIVAGLDRIVVVGSDGFSVSTIAESDDNGVTWVDDTTSPFNGGQANGVFASPSLFISVGDNADDSITLATGVVPPPVPNPDAMRVDAPIRTLITDMDSRTIAHFDRLATDRSWLFTLNGSAYHTGQVPSDNGEVNRPFPDADSPANLTNNRRLLFSLQRWPGATPPYQPIFGGIVTIPEDQGTDAPTTRYTAHDPWQLMMSRPIRDPDTGDLPGPDGITFATGSRASDIALSFLAQTEAFDGESHIDSSDSGLIEATDPLPTSITFDEGTMVGEAWSQLVETGTIDIHLPPMYEPIDAPGKVVRFQTVRQADGVAAGPIRASAVMGWDRAGNSLAEVNRLVDGTRMANTVQFYDQNGNAVPVQTDPDSITANGVYFAQQFFPGANDTTLIALLAVAQLVIRRNGQRSIALSPAPERSVLPLRDYNLGDYVPVWASSNLREPLGVDYDTFDPDNPGASGYQRIYAIPLAADDNGVTTVTGLLTSKEN